MLLTMPSDERREAIVAAPPRRARSRGPPARRSTRGRGPAHRSAASRSTSSRTASRPRAGAPAQPGRAVELACRRAARPTRRSAAPARRASASGPTASKFSSAKPSGSIRAWQLAHAGFARCCAIARASSAACRVCAFVSLSAGTSGGGGGGGVPSRFSSIHLPRSTGDVRCGYDVTVRMLPCPSRPRRGAARSSVTRRKSVAVDVRDAVVLRQPLVDERVVGGQQLEHAAILANDALEEELRLAPHRPRRFSSKSGNSARIGRLRRRGCAGSSHCPAKLVDERRRRADRPASAAPAARAPPAPRACPRVASVEQLVVGNAAPEEERQPRRQLEIADPDATPAAAAGGSRSTRNRNSGLTSTPLERALDARLEAAVGAARLVERQQRLQIRRRDRPPVGAPRQRRQDLCAQRSAGPAPAHPRLASPGWQDEDRAGGSACRRVRSRCERPADRRRSPATAAAGASTLAAIG